MEMTPFTCGQAPTERTERGRGQADQLQSSIYSCTTAFEILSTTTLHENHKDFWKLTPTSGKTHCKQLSSIYNAVISLLEQPSV